jgi:predicted GIY-YIG superfamily endonuclease
MKKTLDSKKRNEYLNSTSIMLLNNKNIEESAEESDGRKIENFVNTLNLFFVYILVSKNLTYVGATTDLNKRLRQHNSIIKGGAKYTTRVSLKGQLWSRVLYVKHFPSWIEALKFEWKLKNISRKKNFKKLSPIERRLRALRELLASDRSTKSSTPFKDWIRSPKIVFGEELRCLQNPWTD